jgi:hypothetical protein
VPAAPLSLVVEPALPLAPLVPLLFALPLTALPPLLEEPASALGMPALALPALLPLALPPAPALAAESEQALEIPENSKKNPK